MNHRNPIRAAMLVVAVIMCALPLCAASGPLPPNTKLQVRINERLSSETAKAGDTFHGTLAQPVVVNGKTVFDKGTEVQGQVLQASKSGRLSSPGQLQLALTSISGGWFRSYAVSAQPLVITAGSHTKSNIAKIGGGAAAGAIVGGVAGGGKGAAIGTGVGAGAGTVVAAVTGKHEAVVESEAVLTWTTMGNQPMAPSDQSTRSRYPQDSDYVRHDSRSHRDEDEDEDDDRDRQGNERRGNDRFSEHDRIVLRGCFGGENYSNLPPGLAKRDRLPPGLEKQLERNGTLPPGLQKRVQPLPESCEIQLPRLPHEWRRVILSGRIILLDEMQRILDTLDLRNDD